MATTKQDPHEPVIDRNIDTRWSPFEDWNWEKTLQLVATVVVAGVLIFAGCFAAGTQDVTYYYLSTSNSYPGACVYAHWTWHSDERAFCSDDYTRALDFATKANQALKASK